MQYDIAVIGNDEAAFEMLNLAAAANKRTLAILPETRHSMWFVGQALRRLVSGLLVDRTPHRRRMFRSAGSPRLLHTLLTQAIVAEMDEYSAVLEQSGVHVMPAEARFVDSSNLQVWQSTTGRCRTVRAGSFVIGTGVRRCPMHRPHGHSLFLHPESLFTGRSLPESVNIIGGDQFGAGLAALMSLFGVRTRLAARTTNCSAMLELASAAGVAIAYHAAETGSVNPEVRSSGSRPCIVDCRRSVGFTDHLGLDTIGIEPDERGQLWCASNFETWCSGIFGIGDVVGFSPDTALQPSVQAERVMEGESRRTSTWHNRSCA